MAAHADFKVATGVAMGFCDSHLAWKRGTRENSYELPRQYLLRSTDLATVTASHLDSIAAKLNKCLREKLD